MTREEGPTSSSSGGPFPRRIWLMALGAVLLRAASSLTIVVVAPDGSRYLRMARLLLEGNFDEALAIEPVSHPLYPLLIALGGILTDEMALPGAAISAILGGFSLLPLYSLARRAWNERVAEVTSFLYLFLPSVARLHGEVMTEGTFMFFFLGAMALGWSALESRSWERAVLAGLGAGLAWLTRPEGAYLPLMFVLAGILRRSRFAPAALGISLTALLLLSFPYLTWIRARTGRWSLSANPFSAGIVGLLTGETPATGYQVTPEAAEEYKEYRDIARYGRVGGPVVTLSRTIARNYFYVLVPFLLVGFFRLGGGRTRWGPALFVFAGAIGYFIPPVLAFVAATPFGYRYILIPQILLLPVAALGILRASEWMRHPRALPALQGILAIGMTVNVLRPMRTEKIGLKEAGLAIRREFGPGRRILGVNRQVEYYARANFVHLDLRKPFPEVERLIEDEGIEFLILYLQDLRLSEPGFLDRVEARYRFWGEFPGKGPKGVTPVRVYRTRLS